MADPASSLAPPKGATGVIVFADGTVVWGRGFGHVGSAVGEVCFNTAMTGYQEVMTDPSYAGQIVTFTFPHIGNVGTNPEDIESEVEGAVGCIVREDVTVPSQLPLRPQLRRLAEGPPSRSASPASIPARSRAASASTARPTR